MSLKGAKCSFVWSWTRTAGAAVAAVSGPQHARKTWKGFSCHKTKALPRTYVWRKRTFACTVQHYIGKCWVFSGPLHTKPSCRRRAAHNATNYQGLAFVLLYVDLKLLLAMLFYAPVVVRLQKKKKEILKNKNISKSYQTLKEKDKVKLSIIWLAQVFGPVFFSFFSFLLSSQKFCL